MNLKFWQWGLILVSIFFFFFLSPLTKTTNGFFKASIKNKTPNTYLLTGSLVISWIFAKSITNAANLGMEYGILGGLAYATYYASFAIAGIIIYQMRTIGGFKSIHHFIVKKFGKKAMLLFSLLLIIRLFNEVWSNTMVIGLYFGAESTASYYWAIIVFTILTLAYTLKGGLSSSIFSDAIQMILFAILLCLLLGILFTTQKLSISTVIKSSTWTFEMGLNLFFAALLQSFSYPFHDSVLTDRAFISPPKTTLKSFLLASFIGGICILLFSFIGVYAKQIGLSGQAAAEVGKTFGIVFLLLINFIMLTSAASTLDSTFSSFSKLIAIDLKLGKNITLGRISMIIIAVLGTIPIFFNAEILAATTISGTMVIGLTPIFLFWRKKAGSLSFHLSILTGLIFGFLLLFNFFPEELIFTKGKYANLLWINIWGISSCLFTYQLPLWIKKV